MPSTRFGRRLRQLREARGLTQAALARRAGLSGQAHIALLELGGRRAPTITTVKKLARALRVPAGALLE